MSQWLLVRTKKVKAFVDAINALCEEHGLSISHEDRHGEFQIVELNDADKKWFSEASDKTDPGIDANNKLHRNKQVDFETCVLSRGPYDIVQEVPLEVYSYLDIHRVYRGEYYACERLTRAELKAKAPACFRTYEYLHVYYIKEAADTWVAHIDVSKFSGEYIVPGYLELVEEREVSRGSNACRELVIKFK